MAAGGRRRDPPRIALPVVVLAAAMAAAGIGFGIVQAVQDDQPAPGLDRKGSEPLGAGPAVPIAAPPLSYRITYRVELVEGDTTVERVSVLRPFGKRVEESKDLEELTFGRRAHRRGENTTVFAVPPAASDVRPDVIAKDAVEWKVGERRERRRILGRACQVYRFGTSVTAPGFVEPVAGGDTVEICVDGDGLVLERLERTAGSLFRRRIATRVEPGASVDQEELLELPVEPTLTPVNGGGSIRAVDVSSEPEGRFFVLDAVPPGFEHRGRYSVVPPQPALANPETRNEAIATTDDVYVRGGDMLVVSRGGTLGQQAAFELGDGARRVQLGPVLGEGELVITLAGNEVRVPLPNGQFVKVYGTLSAEQLIEVTRALRETSGGSGLVYLE